RFGQRRIAEFLGAVQYRHFIIVFEYAVAERLVDAANTAHPEGVELGGAQGADAGGAEYVDALGHRPQDLLVPDRRHEFEIAVDDADHRWAGQRRAVDIALAHRRAPLDGALQNRLQCRRQGRAREDDRRHRLAISRARRPGVEFG